MCSEKKSGPTECWANTDAQLVINGNTDRIIAAKNTYAYKRKCI